MTRQPSTEKTENEQFLRNSGIVDEAFYLNRYGLNRNIDSVSHYLEYGWLQGFEPNANFNGAFLQPFYVAAGFSGPPALTWLDLSAVGMHIPSNPDDVAPLVAKIRQCSLFDAAYYARRLPAEMDPLVHYVVIGECLGWQPSEQFDPSFYRKRYDDIAACGISPLLHYNDCGQREGRRALPAAKRLAFPPLLNITQRPVLIISHEASRSGAPILGWNLTRILRNKLPIVSLLMRGGVIEQEFATVSDIVVGPMTWEEWDPVECACMAERLVKTYNPVYAIANSVETSMMVPALAALGVPSVALVHEFASYIRPISKLRYNFDWAPHVVFPAQIVAQSAVEAFPEYKHRRGVHILMQGRQELPIRKGAKSVVPTENFSLAVHSSDAQDTFVVLGVGSVHMRKGVDLFITAAAIAHRLAPDVNFRFVWIGGGYDPELDSAYSAYLHAQIKRSDLENIVFMLDPVENLEPAYAATDVFFLSSRLDPQPNVGIDALTRGIPTICFEGACGTAEVLACTPETNFLVIPHLDAYTAAMKICYLAKNPEFREDLRRSVKQVGESSYDMEAYVNQIHKFGCDAAAQMTAEDLHVLISTTTIEPELAVPPRTFPPGPFGVEQHIAAQWAVVGTSDGEVANANFRRPIAGFHPQAYAVAHMEECGEGGQNPVAHWLRNGCLPGPWSHRVFTPQHPPAEPMSPPRVALHAHFYYPELAPDFMRRLRKNKTVCDLFVSTDTQEKANFLHEALVGHRGKVVIDVMPNRGRDLGPFLSGFTTQFFAGNYDILGHVHSKKSLVVDGTLGDAWRNFLWDNLIGEEYPMLDLAAAAFAADNSLGLLMAEDPHLVGWCENREIAENIATKIGLQCNFPRFFDFPLGTMFWCRPKALQKLFNLGLSWNDFPDEPLPYDGTMLHALERLLPFITASESLNVASLRAPHTTW